MFWLFIEDLISWLSSLCRIADGNKEPPEAPEEYRLATAEELEAVLDDPVVATNLLEVENELGRLKFVNCPPASTYVHPPSLATLVHLKRCANCRAVFIALRAEDDGVEPLDLFKEIEVVQDSR